MAATNHQQYQAALLVAAGIIAAKVSYHNSRRPAVLSSCMPWRQEIAIQWPHRVHLQTIEKQKLKKLSEGNYRDPAWHGRASKRIDNFIGFRDVWWH